MSDLHEVPDLRAAIAWRGAEHSRAIGTYSPRRLVVAALVIAAVACVAIGRRSLPWGRSGLTFRAEGGEVQGNGYLRANPTARTMVYFSDGTQISFHEDMRGRVVAVDDHGARIAIDEGTAQVRVVPRTGSSWTFDAGPFSVNVKAGAFLLAWRGGEAQLDLRVDQGAATVSGPLLHGAAALRAGEWLTVRLDEKAVTIREAPQPSPLEADISIFRAFLADQKISPRPDEADLLGDQLGSDHGAGGDDSVTSPPTPLQPKPSRTR